MSHHARVWSRAGLPQVVFAARSWEADKSLPHVLPAESLTLPFPLRAASPPRVLSEVTLKRRGCLVWKTTRKHCSICELTMRSGAHVSNAFTQNYSPFRGHKGWGPRDSARVSPHTAPPYLVRLRCTLLDGDLPGRPLRCAQTKRTKPAALG